MQYVTNDDLAQQLLVAMTTTLSDTVPPLWDRIKFDTQTPAVTLALQYGLSCGNEDAYKVLADLVDSVPGRTSAPRPYTAVDIREYIGRVVAGIPLQRKQLEFYVKIVELVEGKASIALRTRLVEQAFDFEHDWIEWLFRDVTLQQTADYICRMISSGYDFLAGWSTTKLVNRYETAEKKTIGPIVQVVYCICAAKKSFWNDMLTKLVKPLIEAGQLPLIQAGITIAEDANNSMAADKLRELLHQL